MMQRHACAHVHRAFVKSCPRIDGTGVTPAGGVGVGRFAAAQRGASHEGLSKHARAAGWQSTEGVDGGSAAAHLGECYCCEAPVVSGLDNQPRAPEPDLREL
eukprot:366130-Chlamydomonas_euryale.AAC.24